VQGGANKHTLTPAEERRLEQQKTDAIDEMNNWLRGTLDSLMDCATIA